MATIILAGWREGLKKVALAKLQRELLHLPLPEAKQNVNRLLEAEENVLQFSRPVVLQVPDEVAGEFVRRADGLGALVGVVQMTVPHAPAPTEVTSSQQAA